MFSEEAAELFVVDRLRAASAIAQGAGQPGFRLVDSIGAYMIDEENVEEFVKIAPAALVGITDESVVEPEDAHAQIRLSDYTLTVNIVGKGAWKFKQNSDSINALSRLVKNALAGAFYAPSDGNTENTAHIRFIDRTTLRIDGGLLIAVQRYAIRTLDTND